MGRYRTLIADDAEMSYIFLKNRLGQEFECDSAKDGFEALELCRGQRFDLVITDVHMPILDGLEFITLMRQLKSYRRTPVIIFTADQHACDNQLVLQEQKDIHWMAKGKEPDNFAEYASQFIEANRAG